MNQTEHQWIDRDDLNLSLTVETDKLTYGVSGDVEQARSATAAVEIAPP